MRLIKVNILSGLVVLIGILLLTVPSNASDRDPVDGTPVHPGSSRVDDKN